MLVRSEPRGQPHALLCMVSGTQDDDPSCKCSGKVGAPCAICAAGTPTHGQSAELLVNLPDETRRERHGTSVSGQETGVDGDQVALLRVDDLLHVCEEAFPGGGDLALGLAGLDVGDGGRM